MSQTKQTLYTDEQVLFQCRPHWSVYAPFIFSIIGFMLVLAKADLKSTIGYSLFLIFSSLSIVFFFASLLRRKTTSFSVTSNRILMKVGVLRRAITDMRHNQIQGLSVEQSLLGRIFNFGSISLHGTGGSKFEFPSVPNPMRFQEIIQEAAKIGDR